MEVKSIRCENDAKWAIGRIDELITQNNLSYEQEEELNILSILLSTWENQHFEEELNQYNDLSGMIKFMMDQHGFTKQVDIIPSIFANKPRASEVLNGKRNPSVVEIKKLNEILRIPFEFMMGD